MCDRAFEVGDKCVAVSTLLPAIILPALAVLLAGTLFYVRHAAEAHAIKTIASAELKYTEPKEVCKDIAQLVLVSVVSKSTLLSGQVFSDLVCCFC